MNDEATQQRYHAAMHAIQSGVAALLQLDPSEGTPKHLRVGVNSALISHGALVALLIEKGVFTVEEYSEKLIEYTEKDVASYEAELSKHYGKEIKLA